MPSLCILYYTRFISLGRKINPIMTATTPCANKVFWVPRCSETLPIIKAPIGCIPKKAMAK